MCARTSGMEKRNTFNFVRSLFDQLLAAFSECCIFFEPRRKAAYIIPKKRAAYIYIYIYIYIFFFLTMYARRRTLLILINITIQSWYTYKQHKPRKIQPVVLLQPTIATTTKHKPSPSPEKRSTCSGPLNDAEETPRQEALTIRC
jgi:hypothetical protein